MMDERRNHSKRETGTSGHLYLESVPKEML